MKNSIPKKKLRDFGLLVGFCLPTFIGFLLPYFGGHDFKIWTLLVGIILIFLGIIQPFLLIYPYKIWMKVGYILAWLNSRIILAIVFIFVLQPISLLMKFFNYDPLKQNEKNKKKSFREDTSNKTIKLNRIF